MFSRHILPIVAVAALSMPARAANGAPDEAVALLDRATAHFEQAGPEQAFKDFTNKQGQFVGRDLHVLRFDINTITTAHGGIRR